MPILSALACLHRNALSLLAMLMLALMLPTNAAQGQVTLGELNISGLEAPPNEAIVTRTLMVGPGTVDQIFFDFTVETFFFAWGEDIRILVTAPDGTTRLFEGNSDFGFGGPGTWSFSDTRDFGPVSAKGEWRFQFWQHFGTAHDPNHRYLAGSVIRLQDSGAAPLQLDLSTGSATLTRGQAMDEITATLSGGEAPFSFSAPDGLPVGLQIDENDGTISGIPTEVSAAQDYTVRVTDNTGATADATVNITVEHPPLVLTLPPHFMFILGEEIEPIIATATGGEAPYSFSAPDGLPAGLEIDEDDGTISGTPTEISAAQDYTVRVTDNTGATADATINLIVRPSPIGLLVYQPQSVLTRGQPMDPMLITAVGGDLVNFTFEVTPALPAGLALEETGVGQARIAGTPTELQDEQTYTLTVTYGGGDVREEDFTLEVIAGDEGVAEAFQEGSAAFLSRRSERILSSEPTSWRLDARRRAGGMSDLAMRANDDGFALRFATAHVGSDGLWHVWAEGTLSRYRDATGTLDRRDGSFGMLSAGVDRLINPRLAIGLMAQVDHMGMDFGPDDRFEGTGWLAGPYLSAELTEGLFLSARAAWGQSSNRATLDIAQDGSPLFEGDFNTDRTLARATLHGRHEMAGGMTLLPEIDLAWISDRQRDYMVSDGISDVDVDGISAERLRLSLAATLERPLGDGRMVGFIRPSLAYDRARAAGDETEFAHGSIELGLRSGLGADWRGVASIRQDGIGHAGFDATSLRMSLSRDF